MQRIRLSYHPKLRGTVEVRVQIPNAKLPHAYDTRGTLNLPLGIARALEKALDEALNIDLRTVGELRSNETRDGQKLYPNTPPPPPKPQPKPPPKPKPPALPGEAAPAVELENERLLRKLGFVRGPSSGPNPYADEDDDDEDY